MLFEDLDTLNEVIDLIRSGVDTRPLSSHNKDIREKNNRRYRDLHDPEIDRLYSTSPPESEQVGTYFELDSALLSEYHNDGDTDANEGGRVQKEASTLSNEAKELDYDIHSEYMDPVKVFRKQDPKKLSQSAVVESGLSLLLRHDDGLSSKGGPSIGSAMSPTRNNGMKLTIYLPSRLPLEVVVDPSDTVDIVIRSVLQTDSASNTPTQSLHHHAPQCYELRLHEGDGEPDEDFPALDRKRVLKQVGNVSEYCLCCKSGVQVPPPPPANASVIGKPVSPEESLPEDVIVVLLPNEIRMNLRIEPATTPSDIIALISKKHRLKLYTVDYVCCVTDEDKRRLQLTSPILDSNRPIQEYNIRKVELHQREYADSSRAKALKRANHNAIGSSSMSLANIDSNMLFTDVTATVYQEWNVVKKNKFGRMQERILGIDGTHLYNSKRLGHGNQSGVSHAVRHINTVVEVHEIPEDPTSFRVTFDDGREIYDIGYTCESSRERFEITSKLRYLLSSRGKTE